MKNISHMILSGVLVLSVFMFCRLHGFNAERVSEASMPVTRNQTESGADDYRNKLSREILSMKVTIGILREELSALQAAMQQTTGRQMVSVVPAMTNGLSGTGAADGNQNDALVYPRTDDGASHEIIQYSNRPQTLSAEERQREDIERMQASYDSFAAESLDEAWAADTSRMILQAFDGAEFGQSTLGDIECRSSSCRVSVLLPDEETMDEFVLKFPMLVGKTLPGIKYQAEPYADGQVNVVMYMNI